MNKLFGVILVVLALSSMLFFSCDDAVRYNTVGFSDKPVREVSVRAKAPVASRVEILAGNDVIARIDIPKSTCWTTVHAKVDNRMISSSSHMTEKSKVMQVGLSGNAAPDTSRIYDISVRLSRGRDVAIDYIGFDMMPWTEGGMTTDTYRNLFAEMGYSQKQIDENLQNTTGRWRSPWRVIIVGELKDVVASTLVTDVSEPCRQPEWHEQFPHPASCASRS